MGQGYEWLKVTLKVTRDEAEIPISSELGMGRKGDIETEIRRGLRLAIKVAETR
jgi:hypothetical protein